MELNWVTYLVLGSFLFHLLFEAISIRLNLNCMITNIPAEFAEIYDAKAYSKSQEYTRAKSLFSLTSSLYSTAMFLGVWFTEAFNIIDVWVRSFFQNAVVTGVLYIFILGLIFFTLEIPVLIYSTFVLEAEFGFNKTTVKTFVLDQIKKLVLFLLLGGPLLAMILLFLDYIGTEAWIYCWIIVSLFTVLMAFVGPKYLLPLFNTLTPLKNDALEIQIRNLAHRIKFSYRSIFIMDGSKRSNHSNAFFAGFGSTKRIILFDTLIEKQTQDEIVAILGHEMGHYMMGHIYSSMTLSIVHLFGLFYALSIFITNDALFNAFLLKQSSLYAGLFLFSQILAPIEFFMQLFFNAFSRYNEFQADRFAVDCIENPDALVTGLKKLSVDNLSNLTPHWLTVFVNYTHPPVLMRINAIREHARLKIKRAS